MNNYINYGYGLIRVRLQLNDFLNKRIDRRKFHHVKPTFLCESMQLTRNEKSKKPFRFYQFIKNKYFDKIRVRIKHRHLFFPLTSPVRTNMMNGVQMTPIGLRNLWGRLITSAFNRHARLNHYLSPLCCFFCVLAFILCVHLIYRLGL